MLDFILDIKTRNQPLFFFGAICLAFSIIMLILTKTSHTSVYGVNAYYKPFKFAISTFLFAWTMAWYCHYLNNFNIGLYNWTVIILLGFEIVYIALMASKGQTSHYNVSRPLHSVMFSLMALAATWVTLHTAYIGFLFFQQTFPELPSYYVWAIRIGIVLFTIFSLEGFAMGARLSHSVGAINDNSNWFILGWSKTVGDLRVAHFIGMHALQVLPILSFYLLKNTKATVFVGLMYGVLAFSVLFQALKGKPLFPNTKELIEEK
jgi:hypothetical protein